MQPRTVINKNTGPQTRYRKVQDSYKNTGVYRTAGITAAELYTHLFRRFETRIKKLDVA